MSGGYCFCTDDVSPEDSHTWQVVISHIMSAKEYKNTIFQQLDTTLLIEPLKENVRSNLFK